jgi:hypothetical protein
MGDGICSRSQKINRIDWGPNQSLIQKEKSLSWTGRVDVGSQTFRGRRRRQTPDGRQSDGHFFFVQIGFFSIKSPNSSRKSIKKIFLEITKSVNITLRVDITQRVEITFCVWKSQSAYINHTRACWNHTLHSEITLARVFITVCVWTSHIRVISTRRVWF